MKEVKSDLYVGDLINTRENNFDLLRLLAAIFVMVAHSFPLTGNPERSTLILNMGFGSLGVKIFFVISGFLIVGSYVRNPNVFDFMKSRILRIYPALIVVILLSVFLLGPLVTNLSLKEYFLSAGTYQYLKMLTLFEPQFRLPGVFDSNIYKETVNGSLWTLEYEVTFYLIIALLGVLGLLKPKILLSLFALIFSLFELHTRYTSLSFGTINIGYFLEFFIYFLAGSLIFLYKEFIKLDKIYLFTIVGIFLISIPFGGVRDEVFVFIGSYLVLYLSLTPRIKFYKYNKMGDLSYGLYIYAFPVQQLITFMYGGRMEYPIINFLIALIFSLLLAFISWNLIEKKALRLKSLNFKKSMG